MAGLWPAAIFNSIRINKLMEGKPDAMGAIPSCIGGFSHMFCCMLLVVGPRRNFTAPRGFYLRNSKLFCIFAVSALRVITLQLIEKAHYTLYSLLAKLDTLHDYEE